MPPLSILIWLPAACGLMGALLPAASGVADGDSSSSPRKWSAPGVLALVGSVGALGLAIAYIVQ
jgi:hypothetical protein